jgi:hypothetical protein
MASAPPRIRRWSLPRDRLSLSEPRGGPRHVQQTPGSGETRIARQRLPRASLPRVKGRRQTPSLRSRSFGSANGRYLPWTAPAASDLEARTAAQPLQAIGPLRLRTALLPSQFRSAQHQPSPARRASTTGPQRRTWATPPRLVWCKALLDGATLLATVPKVPRDWITQEHVL